MFSLKLIDGNTATPCLPFPQCRLVFGSCASCRAARLKEVGNRSWKSYRHDNLQHRRYLPHCPSGYPAAQYASC
jgi:hypothetical protein